MYLFTIILQDVSDTFCYIKFAVLAACIITAIAVIVISKVWGRTWKWKERIKWGVFITYAIVLVQIALLSREPGSRTAMDLIPFSTWGSTNQCHAYVIENIIMFLPMGVLLPMMFRPMCKVWGLAIATFVISMGIEVTQFITQRGYFQTDDIIMNVLGGVIGFYLFRTVKQVYKEN